MRDQQSEVVAWGSYDETKPRVRLLLEELRARGALRAEINIPVWKSVRDKAVVGYFRTLKILLRLIAEYPNALLKLIRQPSGCAVLLAYPAIPDIFAVWPVARSRGHTIIFDAFISLYDTVVADRGMLRSNSISARLVWSVEWLALRLADIILVDTDQHADFFANEYRIPRDRFQTILVGAEPAFWEARNAPVHSLPASAVPHDRPIVLFFGQLIPLHGIDTILEAIRLTEGEPFQWLIIGSGQEEPKVRRFIAEHEGKNVNWIPWVEYHQLPAYISASSVALGIFGTSEKAARVIPNKAFQVLAVGKPLITRDSPAIEPLAKRYPNAVVTVPAGNGTALAGAIRKAVQDSALWQVVPVSATKELGPALGVKALLQRLS